MTDLLIIKPSARKKLYQELSKSFSGLEPPLWAALLAGFIREKGYSIEMVDMEVESEKLERISLKDFKLVTIIVSGINPSASTMNMTGVLSILDELGCFVSQSYSILIGLHPSALPEESLHRGVDFVCEGEGFQTILGLLRDIPIVEVPGLWYCLSPPSGYVNNSRADLMNLDSLPQPAWDLLPMERYRSHHWHAWSADHKRVPYGVIYTSLGCPFNCSFCCINAMFGKYTIRYRSPEKVISDIAYLVEKHNTKNIKIIDEMFDLNEKHVIDICDMIIERKYDLNMWAYARIDTINERKLEKMKKAGINWLGIGIEAANDRVRANVSKGKFGIRDVREIAKMIRDFGISIGGNFIFGLPGDTFKTMQETLDLAMELKCEYTNFYPAMAFPGSKLYDETPKDLLPKTFSGYSPYSYDCQPIPTKDLTSAEILKFRDEAFMKFYTNQDYLNSIEKKFGLPARQETEGMTKIKLKRRLLGD